MGRRLRAVVVAVAFVVLAACDGGGGEVESVVDRTAAVYETVLRWVLDDRNAPRTMEEDELPVVYVVGDGVEIDSEVQATVVKSMLDDATVRFADEREEALDENLESTPVLDEGVLVLLGPVPDQGVIVDMPTEVYVDEVDDTQWELVVARSGTSWAVSSARLVS